MHLTRLSGFSFSLLSTLLFLPFCLQAQTPDFILDQNIFTETGGKKYLEVYLYIDGLSLVYKPNERNLYTASVSVEIELTREGNLIKKDQYKLQGPELADTLVSTRSGHNLLDLQRYYLEPGLYTLAARITDAHADNPKVVSAVRDFECRAANPEKTEFSDIQFFLSRTKSEKTGMLTKPDGKDYIPMVTNSSFIRQDSLNFYVEVYNSKLLNLSPYYISASIRQANSDRTLEQYSYTLKKNPSAFDVFAGTLTIQSLPSQTYVLTVEILNASREVQVSTSRKFFVFNDQADSENQNDYLNYYDLTYGYPEKELDYHISSLRLISTTTELSFVKTLKTYEEKKSYFYGFWEKRKSEPLKYTEINNWPEFHKLVLYANQKFKSRLRDGWETDRGRILLQYGIPNDVQTYPSMNNTVPYEIWTYNKLGVQPGVIFVFADSDLTTNEYPLIHSTKYGEANNPRWRLDLLSRFKDANTVDYDNIDRNRDIRGEFFDITPR